MIAINDSPDDDELKPLLRQAVADLSAVVPCRVIENAQNIGFGRSVNGAASESVANRHDVILLNSDTIVFPGAIAELQRVANLDPMIGFVSPRSNNATICSFPPQPEFQQAAAGAILRGVPRTVRLSARLSLCSGGGRFLPVHQVSDPGRVRAARRDLWPGL